MKSVRGVLAALMLGCALLALQMAPAQGQPTIPLSNAAGPGIAKGAGPLDSGMGNAPSGLPDEAPGASADGTFAAYSSLATNLTPRVGPAGLASLARGTKAGASDVLGLLLPDTNGVRDIYLHEQTTALNFRVSVSTAGAEANGASRYPAVSADGRFVAFESDATNLAGSDLNGAPDVYLHDILLGTTELVSGSIYGPALTGGSYTPSISGDGRYVAFASDSPLLVATPADTNGATDVFVRDRKTGAMRRVTVGALGQGNGRSWAPAISTSGRTVAFTSSATNFVVPDANGSMPDVFLWDMTTGLIKLVSSSAGVQANAPSGSASVSADGRMVAFDSLANNLDLLLPDTNGVSDAFVRDMQTGRAERVSIGPFGEGDGPSSHPAISADGKTVAFSSKASNLIVDDINGTSDVFVRLAQGGTSIRAASRGDLGIGNDSSHRPGISADGLTVTFSSDASNLVASDQNGASDAFANIDETRCPTGAEEQGPLSDPLHHQAEPAAGSAEHLLHRLSCAAAATGA